MSAKRAKQINMAAVVLLSSVALTVGSETAREPDLTAQAGMAVPAAPGTEIVNLRAEATTVTMPDAAVIPMWAFGRDADPVSVPGPEIRVTEGDTLTINLTNNLPEQVSIVIPGQLATMTPQKFQDGQGRWRVRSFTHETGISATQPYTWANLKAGTYLYHSGTHPAVQVQMGLYGLLIVESATAGQAYDDASSAFDTEFALLYSEIDPALHAAVDGGTYVPFGDPEAQMTSTIDYDPKYFLINGAAYPDTATLSGIAEGDRVLLRFLNAGLQTHAPLLLGSHMSIIAEDGNLYPYPRVQYSLGLPAGQTQDAIVTLSTAGTYPLFDRRLNLTNVATSPGGMLTYLEVDPAPPAP